MSQPSHTLSPGQERLIIAVDRVIYHLARHWVWLLNGIAALFVVPPLVAPYLAATGHTVAASWIYRFFSLTCHQKPEHSFFIAGHQVAFCQRDTAIYGGLLLFGLLYAVVRHRVRPASLWIGALLAAPMAVDGLTQLVGLRESTPTLRVLTGGLFALGVAWIVFPRLNEGFAEIEAVLRARFDRLAREGRARPLAAPARKDHLG